MPGFIFTQNPIKMTTQDSRKLHHSNHRPMVPAGSAKGARISQPGGVKEVLMVLNATGKMNFSKHSKETWDGYYPQPQEEESSQEKSWLTPQLDIQMADSGGEEYNTGEEVNIKHMEDSNDDTNNTTDINDITEHTTEMEDTTTTEPPEFSSFYPINDNDLAETTTTVNLVDIYDNLSELVDSWDEDVGLYEDQVARDLAELNKEIAALEAQEAL